MGVTEDEMLFFTCDQLFLLTENLGPAHYWVGTAAGVNFGLARAWALRDCDSNSPAYFLTRISAHCAPDWYQLVPHNDVKDIEGYLERELEKRTAQGPSLLDRLVARANVLGPEVVAAAPEDKAPAYVVLWTTHHRYGSVTEPLIDEELCDVALFTTYERAALRAQQIERSGVQPHASRLELYGGYPPCRITAAVAALSEGDAGN